MVCSSEGAPQPGTFSVQSEDDFFTLEGKQAVLRVHYELLLLEKEEWHIFLKYTWKLRCSCCFALKLMRIIFNTVFISLWEPQALLNAM